MMLILAIVLALGLFALMWLVEIRKETEAQRWKRREQWSEHLKGVGRDCPANSESHVDPERKA